MVTPTDWENSFTARHGWPEDHFLSPFVQRRREMGHPVLTKGFLQLSPKAAMLPGPSVKPTYLPGPFLLVQNLSPKDIAGSDITSWQWHHKLKVLWHINSSIVYNRLMGPFQHILRINQEILSSPRYQARSVSNPPPIVHTTRTEKLNHEVGEDWETRAS